MRPLHWDVDPQDWESTDRRTRSAPGSITAARPGSIILLHDGGGDRHGTLAACPGMIADLKRAVRHRPAALTASFAAVCGAPGYRFGATVRDHVCFRKPPAGPDGSTVA